MHVLDTGKWDKPIHTQEYVSTTGVLMPFYDSDTKLVFLVGKGTNKLFIAEFQSKTPYLSPGLFLVFSALFSPARICVFVSARSLDVCSFLQYSKCRLPSRILELVWEVRET